MALQTSSRLFAVLAELQARPLATAPDLAERLGVSERTIRKDVDRLRELGYPVDAVRGPAGGYRFGDHGRLPPLLLDADEAVAVAVGLSSVTAVRGVEEAGIRALTKLQHVLPDRLWRRVHSVHESTDIGPAETATNALAPPVDVALLADLATAIRDREGLRIVHRAADADHEQRLEADPYRLVSWQQRWYLVARVRPSGDWQALRVDRVTLRTPGAGRFAPRPMADDGYADFVLRTVAFSGWNVHCRITVDAPAEEVLRRINPTVGVVEPLETDRCVLVTGADSIEMVAVFIGLLGLDFHVTDPPELVEHLRTLAVRYAGAVPPG